MAKKTKKNNSKLLSSPFTKNILMILGILVIGYFAVSIFLKSITRHSNVYILPDFSGMTIDQAQELADIIRKLSENPVNIKEMRLNCRSLYLKKYTKEICTEQYVSLFRGQL